VADDFRPLLGGDLFGLDHQFPAGDLSREELGELCACIADDVETNLILPNTMIAVPASAR